MDLSDIEKCFFHAIMIQWLHWKAFRQMYAEFFREEIMSVAYLFNIKYIHSYIKNQGKILLNPGGGYICKHCIVTYSAFLYMWEIFQNKVWGKCIFLPHNPHF